MKLIKSKQFKNGIVYALETEDGYPVETTDTFLPYYTKNCINEHSNKLNKNEVGSRKERWMIGVSVASGCPVGCKFCATGKLKRWRNLSWKEIYSQIYFVIDKASTVPSKAKEFKINFTRMGEPFLNINNVKETIKLIREMSQDAHCYVSTIGIKGADYSWIEGNTTLQLSIHALSDKRRDELIPYRKKATLEELGKIRTRSNLKTTVNLTLVDEHDFDIEVLKRYFDPEYFFIKLSPLNKNETSDLNKLEGVIEQTNLI